MNDLIGTVLAQRYQVVQFVGRGGMADVYKVWDIQRSVFLAIKVLKEDLAEDEIFLRRFRREAQILSQLQHPFIIRSYGLVQADGLAFLVMDFIEGSTLRKQIFNRKSPWPADLLIAVMRPVCAALNFAHTQGLVHCDVKPANIMLTSTGDVLLADFGIARMTESATTATMVGAGTPAYMAPEQIQGEEPRPQTDIYALGIILFELLTGGERPFTGEDTRSTGSNSEKVRWEHIHRMPPSPRSYNSDIPAGMETIVLKCLEKNPNDRFSTSMELESALEQVYPNVNLSERPVWSIPASTPVEAPAPPFYTQQPTNLPVAPSPTAAFANQSVGQPKHKLLLPIWMILIVLSGVIFVAAFALSSRPADPTAAPQTTGISPGNFSETAIFTAKVLESPTNNPATQTITKATQATLTPVAVSLPVATTNQPFATIQLSPTIFLTPTTKVSSAPPCTAKGQTWIREKDQARMICIPAGSFVLGQKSCSYPGCENEINGGSINLPAFWIDLDEVTIAQFKSFVSETSFITGAESTGASGVFGLLQPVPGASWRSPQGPKSSVVGKDDYPVEHMNWYAANEYCKWAGGLLPSEVEWEKAARGTDGRVFPWGNEFGNASYLNAADRNYIAAWSSKDQNDGYQFTAPVGSFPKGNSFFGVHDMAGNVFEWTRSLMTAYPYDAKDGREKTNPNPNDHMVMRGGSFYTDYGTIRSTRRAESPAQDSSDGYGFRCVVDR